MSLKLRIIWIAIVFLFFPLYFLRLRLVPIYKIPENTEVRLRGRVTRQTYLKGPYQIIYLESVVIKTNRFPGYFYNQKLEVIGKFKKRVISQFQDQYVSYFPTIRVIDQEGKATEKFNLRAFLFQIRNRLERAVGGLLPEPQSSLLLGILFGVKRQMPQEFWQALQETGTLHIVVASGQNVTMVAWFLVEVLTWIVSRRKALAVALLGVALYILLVGAEAPVVRAGIMLAVASTAQFWGREEEGTLALLIAAGMMLLISPLLLFDIGFQLSFAATAGLIWIGPMLGARDLEGSSRVLVQTKCEAANFSLPAQSLPRAANFVCAREGRVCEAGTSARFIKDFPDASVGELRHRFAQNYHLTLAKFRRIFFLPGFGPALATTLAAQLAVMPIILLNFGQVSFLSPLINGLILWVVPLVMVLGGMMVGLALIIKPLGQVIAWFVWLLLTYFVKIIEISGKLPWVSFELGRLSFWWAVGYYFVLVLVVLRFVYRQRSLSIGEAKKG